MTNFGFDKYFNMPSRKSYSLETKVTVVKRYHELGENTSDLHILFSSTGTLWSMANVVVLLNDKGSYTQTWWLGNCSHISSCAYKCGGALIFGNKPMRLYARKYGTGNLLGILQSLQKSVAKNK